MIELLAVIVILGVVMLVAVPQVLGIITDTKRKAFMHKANGLVESIVNEVSSTELTDGSVAGTYTIVDGKIVEANSFKYDGQIPESGTFTINADGEIKLAVYDGTWCVTKDFSESTYKTEIYSGSCPESEVVYTAYGNGTAIYFNPVTGSTCTAGEAVSTTGTKTGCMKWYTFNDAGSTSENINLILDHNTTATVLWNSTGSNVSGPTNVMTQLLSDTSSWSGVPTRTDSYSVNNGTATYTINYNTYKARLVSAAEIAIISGNSSFVEATTLYTSWFYLDSNNQIQTATTTGASNYDWLFDYTIACTGYGCNIDDASNYGYWASTAVSNLTTHAWSVNRNGGLNGINIGDTGRGVRPVITISKTIL